MGLIKKIAYRIARPFWKVVRPFIYTRIDWRIYQVLEGNSISALPSHLRDGAFEQLAPAFLNAVSMVQTFSRELLAEKKRHADEIARLENDIATLRRQVEALKERATLDTSVLAEASTNQR